MKKKFPTNTRLRSGSQEDHSFTMNRQQHQSQNKQSEEKGLQ